MFISNFILLMSGPDMAALASLEALLLYVVAPIFGVILLYLLFSIIASLFSKKAETEHIDNQDTDQVLQATALDLQRVESNVA